VLLACVRLRVFDQVADGPLSADALQARLQLPRDAALALLDAAVALRLLQRRGGGYGLGLLGAALRGNPGLSAMIEHHALLYADLQDPVALLRGQGGPTALARYWAYAGAAQPAALTAAQVADYSALMAASQQMIIDEVLDAYPLDRHRCLLDVGGGEGAFAGAAATRSPRLQLMLFDLPAVAERARARFARAGLAARATCHGGDFLRDPLPLGADVISLVRVAFDHPDHVVVTLLQAVHAALPPGGTLLLAEPMAAAGGPDAIGGAYFAWYLLAMGKGRARTPAQLAELASAAGFTDIRPRATRSPLLVNVLTARRGRAAAS
jgi:demethylspheroidene O-methyltransferase